MIRFTNVFSIKDSDGNAGNLETEVILFNRGYETVPRIFYAVGMVDL